MTKLIKSLIIVGTSLIAMNAFAGGYSSYHNSNKYNYSNSMHHGSSYGPAKQSWHTGHQAGYSKTYPNIVAAAVATPDLSTLVTALKKANLVSALQGQGPFIVFAPTNAAFNQLPPGTLDNLLKPENMDQLQSVLKYHVVPTSFTTLQGQKLKVKVKMVNNAQVVKRVKTGNGTVYVINRVLLPAK